ncbi:NUDIX hydrolase [Microlunatus sp. GCM10028923]|uniref:NUDIX hydrolase n=1 Tax=Microlunatus sp. GCM10028923 TaxID=3273400 RepID=UPI003610DDB4
MSTSDQRVQRIGAYAVCRAEDGSLLLSRYRSGTWSLPGGGVDHGEHPEQGVVREVEEETGYLVRVTELLGIHTNRWTTNTGHDLHSVNILYRVEIVGGELRHEVDGSSDQAGWLSDQELDQVPRTKIIDLVRNGAPVPPSGSIGL